MTTDPVCGMNVEEGKAAATAQHGGKTYYFCSTGCKVNLIAGLPGDIQEPQHDGAR